MQHRVEADPGEDLIMVTTAGDATVEGIRAFLDDIISHPAWRPGMSILLDHRNLNLSHIKQKGVEQVSDYFASISQALGDGKIALVMNKAVDFGITRAWEIITQDRTNMQIHVFRDLDPARLWIRGNVPQS